MSKPDSERPCQRESDAVAYLQDELPARERAEFAAHIENCGACRSLVESAGNVLNALKQDSAAAVPSHDLVSDIMARIPAAEWQERPERILRPQFSLPALAGAAAVILISVAAGLFFLFNDTTPARENNTALSRQPDGTGIVAPDTTPARNSAIVSGLAWLRNAQEPDGSWNAAKWGAPESHTVGVTALSMLALLADTCGDPDNADSIKRAVAFLCKNQDTNGAFGPQCANSMYNHGIAAVALIKAGRADSLAGDAALDKACDLAVRYICSAQQTGGGWGYTAGNSDRPNTSVSVWQLQALLAAKDGGQSGLAENIRRATMWLGNMVDGTGQMGYSNTEQSPPTQGTLTAAGLLCLAAADPALQKNGKFSGMFAAILSGMSSPDDRPDYYRSYFITRALRLSGDNDARTRITAKIEGNLIASQTRQGPAAGSWETRDQWTSAGGLVYNTSMAILALE